MSLPEQITLENVVCLWSLAWSSLQSTELEFPFGSNCISRRLPWGCFYQIWSEFCHSSAVCKPELASWAQHWNPLLPSSGECEFSGNPPACCRGPCSDLCHLQQERWPWATWHSNKHPLPNYFSPSILFPLTWVNSLIICLPLASNPSSTLALSLALRLPTSPEMAFKDHSLMLRPSCQPENKNEWITFQGNTIPESHLLRMLPVSAETEPSVLSEGRRQARTNICGNLFCARIRAWCVFFIVHLQRGLQATHKLHLNRLYVKCHILKRK